MLKRKSYFLFFLGTEAELIKMAPVIHIFIVKKIPFKIVSTGQNDIRKSTILEYLKIPRVDIVIHDKPITQTPYGLVSWFAINLVKSVIALRKEKKSNNVRCLIVHGDTVTTMMGAIAGKLAGLKVAHVEAGYKSGNFLNPFPEELDRAVASAFSDVLFCPYDSIGFVPKTNKTTVNIGLNTAIDTLKLALRLPNKLRLKKLLAGKKYFIFAMHRQENLLNTKLVRRTIGRLIQLKGNLFCVFAQHTPTKKVLQDLCLYEKLIANKNIILCDRLPYFEYAHLLDKSEFIMTDGAGNQQESYYLGKPFLILRNKTEGKEGLNSNALISRNDEKIIEKFFNNYQQYRKKPVKIETSPSKIICDYLFKNF